MAGEAYDGAPKFRLLADGREIGIREIVRGVDTTGGDKLRVGPNSPPPASESFLFRVADIQNVSHFDVEFINDAQAGGGAPGDRNLYLLSLSISMVKSTSTASIITIHQFLPTAFEPRTTMRDGAAVSPTYAALYQKGFLRLQRPTEGWGNGPVENPADKKVSAEIAGAEGSSPPIQPQETQRCSPSSVTIDGFAKNSDGLSTEMRSQLENITHSFANTACAIRVTAFAAGGPSQKFRDQLSAARAEAVAKELARLGLASDKIQAEGATGRGRHVLISFE